MDSKAKKFMTTVVARLQQGEVGEKTSNLFAAIVRATGEECISRKFDGEEYVLLSEIQQLADDLDELS
jgi:hypothetical protein